MNQTTSVEGRLPRVPVGEVQLDDQGRLVWNMVAELTTMYPSYDNAFRVTLVERGPGYERYHELGILDASGRVVEEAEFAKRHNRPLIIRY